MPLWKAARRGTILLAFTAGFVLTLGAPAPAAPFGTTAEPEAHAPAPDPHGRETPRGTVDGLVAAFGTGDPGAVLPFLDLEGIPPERQRFAGRRLARQLETVLDRAGGLLPGFRISAQPGGMAGDDLPADLDRFAVLRTAEGTADLTLRRSADGEAQVWRVSPEALAAVAAAAPRGPALVERFMPAPLRDTRLAGVSLAGWLGLGGAGAAALCGGLALAWLLRGVAARLVRPLCSRTADRFARSVRLPAALILGALMFEGLAVLFGVPVVARAIASPVVETGAWLALAWLVLRAVNMAFEEILRRMTLRERLGAVSVVAIVRRLAKGVVMVAAAILIAGSLGLDLTGWLAALGLGGLAFALGAQKTIEHMVGGLSLVADQPVRVGDFCKVDGVMGTVEDIGLRSTRIRTLDRTLVTIPNGDLSTARIENFAGRGRFLWQTTLGLRYETRPEQMRAVLRRLDRMMAADPRIAEDHRARFTGFGASSLDVEIFAYILAPDMPTSLRIREELNLAVMEIVSSCGAGFAFPSTTVYLARDEQRASGKAGATAGASLEAVA